MIISEENKKITQAIVENTGRVYCPGCCELTPLETGKWVYYVDSRGRRGKRWKCASCQEKARQGK